MPNDLYSKLWMGKVGQNPSVGWAMPAMSPPGFIVDKYITRIHRLKSIVLSQSRFLELSPRIRKIEIGYRYEIHAVLHELDEIEDHIFVSDMQRTVRLTCSMQLHYTSLHYFKVTSH